MELINFSKNELNLLKLLTQAKDIELKKNKTAKDMDEQEDLDFKILQAKQKCINTAEITKIVEQLQTQEQAKELLNQIKENAKKTRKLIKTINTELENEKKYPLLNNHILKSWKMDIESKELALARIFVNNKCSSVEDTLELVEDFLENKTDDIFLALRKVNANSKALNFNNCYEINSVADLTQIIKKKEYNSFEDITNEILTITKSNNYIRRIFTINKNKDNTFYALISTNEFLKIEYGKTTENQIKILNITETFIKQIEKEEMGE